MYWCHLSARPSTVPAGYRIAVQYNTRPLQSHKLVVLSISARLSLSSVCRVFTSILVAATVTTAAATTWSWLRMTATSTVLLHTDVCSLTLHITFTSAILPSYHKTYTVYIRLKDSAHPRINSGECIKNPMETRAFVGGALWADMGYSPYYTSIHDS